MKKDSIVAKQVGLLLLAIVSWLVFMYFVFGAIDALNASRASSAKYPGNDAAGIAQLIGFFDIFVSCIALFAAIFPTVEFIKNLKKKTPAPPPAQPTI